MSKYILSYGTRPELIKVASLVSEFDKRGLSDQLILVNTNQHIQTMHQDEFGIVPHYNLQTLVEGQSMAQLAARILAKLDELLSFLRKEDLTIRGWIVQGDTITTLCAAQTAFFNGIPVYHVEAGLRSDTISSPFPEEFIRRTVSSISSFHFAPSENEKRNLISEGVDERNILVTGNTVNDILDSFYERNTAEFSGRKCVLISIHRKSNQNSNLNVLVNQVLELKEQYPDLDFIWLLHPAPFIRDVVLSYSDRLDIRPNLSYGEVVELYKKCWVVITDSGGIIEESAYLGIPRIIVRRDNERISLSNCVDTFFHEPLSDDLREVFKKALDAPRSPNFVYGDGQASTKICKVLKEKIEIEVNN
jgi:UDP-N-acetylglucosamine 2-epimerase (non-hydrolysing)